MAEGGDRYEVVFTLDPVVEFGSRETFRWTWARIDADGLITVRGDFHPTLQAAIDAASRYRQTHGGGAICVNIHGTPRNEARDAVRIGSADR